MRNQRKTIYGRTTLYSSGPTHHTAAMLRLLQVVTALLLLPLHAAFTMVPLAPSCGPCRCPHVAALPSSSTAWRVRGAASVLMKDEEPEEEGDSLYAQGFDFEFDVTHA